MLTKIHVLTTKKGRKMSQTSQRHLERKKKKLSDYYDNISWW